ncbi:hypothetical protein [Paenibacillus cineris]|uniref:hypothetical protein n=1 Tax=Paenibacillus cineris TaxID=237530 RepID=UPI001B262AD3|nr:hypothetical protein [Paenibacillus cineris]GIO59953.1 hypothetical protein J43TS9_15270 [Paenibacillus cineris]
MDSSFESVKVIVNAFMRLKARVHALPISGKCPFLSARFLALTILAGARKALCGGLFGKKTAGAQLAVFFEGSGASLRHPFGELGFLINLRSISYYNPIN